MLPGPGAVPADRPGRGPPRVSVAGVTLNVTNRNVTLPPDDRQVSLTPLQTALLQHLMTRPGRECSREELMCDALGYSVAVGSRTVDVHIATLRNKLRGALSIRSVRGVGYTLEPARPATH